MRWPSIIAFFLAFNVSAKDYVVPKMDVGVYFATLPDDATMLIFSAATVYSSAGDIPLPSRSLIIDGDMCRLNLGANSNGFVASVADQGDANTKVERKFIIRNFSKITGGKKAVDLSATFMARIEDVELVSQSEAAIDLRFCLMATIQNLKITMNRGDGLRVRCGDWSGATITNSQSNSTTIDRVRVYNGPTAGKAFGVSNCNGVRMMQCVSEGYGPDYDLWLDAFTGQGSGFGNNPVVKQFSLDGFHVEHGNYQAKKASAWVNMPSQCAVSFRQAYWNYTPNRPVIDYTLGQLTIEQVGWWTDAHKIESRIQDPRITIRDCTNNIKASSVRLSSTPMAGNTVLTPTNVIITNTSK